MKNDIVQKTKQFLMNLKGVNSQTPNNMDRTGTVTRAINPERLQQIFLAAQSPGDLGELFELYRKVERYDGKIAGLVERRRKAPTKYNSMIKVENPDIPKTDKVIEFLDEAMNRIDEKKLKRMAMDGILYGVCLGVQRWEFVDGKMFLKNPEKISNTRIGQFNEFNYGQNYGNNRQGKLYIKKDIHSLEKIFIDDYDEGILFKAIASEEDGYHDLSGKLRPLPKLYIFKDSAYKYWVEYSETFGFPTQVLKIDKGDYQMFKDELGEFANNAGRSKYAIIFNGMEYQVHANQSYGQIDVFKELIKFINDEIAFAIVGQNLNEKSSQGSYAESVVGLDIETEIILEDAEFVDKVITKCIVHELIKKNFIDYPLDNISYYTDTPERKDMNKIMAKWKLAKEMGLKGVSKSQIEEELDIKFAKEASDSIDLNPGVKPVDKEKDAERKAEEREESGKTQSKADKDK